MPSLASLTDAYPQQGNGLPVEQPMTETPVSPIANTTDDWVKQAANKDVNTLKAIGGVISSGVGAAGDALSGNLPQYAVDPVTGDVHTSPDMIKRGLDMATVAGTGGIAGPTDATLGSAPFLRPALKYEGKIYKAPPGATEHADALPTHLQDDFYKKAMTGEDINDYQFGFMNHKGQFLDREKALDYGIKEGLIDPSAGQYGVLTSTMLSDASKPGVAIESQKPKYKLVPTEGNPFEEAK